MNRPLQMLGMVLAFCLCLSVRAGEPPKQPDLTKHKKFALHVQKLVRENKSKELADCFDDNALFERALRDLPLPKEVRKSIAKSVKEKEWTTQWANQLCKNVQEDGNYTLLRVRIVDGEHRALFRMLSNSALNYHDLLLAADAAGELHIIDLYTALGAEFISESIRRAACLMVSGNPKQVDQFNRSNVFLKNADRIQRFLKNARTGHYREALKEWDGLPPEVRKEKNIALMRVFSAQGLFEEDENGYKKAIDDFREAFPTDPSVDLISLDGFLLKKKFRSLQLGVDRIERAFGRDPYLDVLRAAGFIKEDKLDEAKKVACRAIKDEPDLIEGYWTLVTISLQAREHKETARLLTDIEKRFKIEFTDLTGAKEYSEFVKSPEYKKWMERRK